jgi:GxxExxY protein
MSKTLSEVEPLNQSTSIILDAAITVHKLMGPGLLESIYHHCLIRELLERGLDVKTMVPVSLVYKEIPLNKDFVIDLLIDDSIIVELKSVEAVLPIHEAQLLSYLKLTNKKIGLLINFNVPRLIQGFKRFVNNL